MFQKFYVRFLLVVLFLFIIGINRTKPLYAATPCYGFVVYSHALSAIPTLNFLQQLNPGCIRMEYDANFPYAAWPTSIKNVVLFLWDQVSSARPPANTASVSIWKTYTDANYIPALQTMLTKNTPVYAIEVWNEEDLCNSNYCPQMPAAAYAYMIKNAARVIKAYNPNIKVVMGGLASGNPQFITDVKNADSAALSQVDAIGFHPYGKSPDGWCVTGCVNTLPFGDLAQAINDYKNAGGLPIWITEIGQSSTDQQWQAQYLQRVFTVLTRVGVPVMTWYSYDDGPGGPWGLVDANHTMLKPSGVTFHTFTPGPTPFIVLPTLTITSPVLTQPVPTVSPISLTLSVLLHGIGMGGDNMNANSAGTIPLHTQRNSTVSIFDATNTLVADQSGTIQYSTASGKFVGTVSVKNVLPGSYIVKIGVDGFLQKQVPGIQTFTSGNTISLPTIALVTGDVNDDNTLDILDYNSLIACFGTKMNSANCTNKTGSDINDDGVVDGTDYNLFLRELSVQQGN